MWHKTLSTASRSNFFNASKASALKNAARPSFAPLARHISTDAQMLNTGLDSVDPQTFAIIENEKIRQLESINLIPSENFTSRAVLECLGSVMQNKYSEGYPKARYYGGNQFIDESESLCQQRALEAFDLDPEKWGVNVQLYSGSPANFAVFAALVEPHQRIMGLDLPHGGHLTHGFQTDNKKISMTSKFWETMPYRLDIKTGCIDYDELEFLATRFKPKLLISGCTAYSRIVDTARFREIADKCGAILHYDLAHISGLVAGGALPSPFEHADVVSTTTHKSLRGPRGAMIFYRKGQKGTTKKGQPIMYDLENKIKETVFPGLQGGPHNHTITALSTALKMANTAEFKEYQNQVIKNSKALAGKLQDLGYDIVSGGTDNHMCLVDLTNMGLSGAKGERICELTNIVLNKNTVPHDKSAMNPSGLRIGTPAMTSRGLVEKDFEAVAEFLDRAVKVGLDVQRDSGKKLDDFTKAIVENEPAPVSLLRKDVAEFASSFEPIGFSLDGASGSASGSARSSQSASA